MTDPLKRQLWLLSTLRALRMFMISVPVIAIYWNSFGLTVLDIMILQVVFSVAWVFFELPSGYLADWFGNKPVIVIGCVMSALGFGVYYFAPSHIGFIVAEIILALSASLVSGARDSMLHDTLRAYGAHNQYTTHRSRLDQVAFSSEAVAALLAGIIVSQLSLPAVLLVQCLVLILSVPVSLSLAPYNETRQNVEPLTSIIRYCFIGNKRLFWFNIFTGTISASTLTMVWYTQLHWKSLGIPIEYFGLLWAGFMFVAIGGSRMTPHLERELPVQYLFAGILVGPVVLYMIMGSLSTTALSLSALWMFWLVRGVAMPVISHYVMQETSDSNRATVLSAQSLITRMIFSITAPCLGWVADGYSFGTAFILSGLTFGIVGAVGYWRWYQLHQLKRG